MADFDWQSFLKKFSADLLADEDVRESVSARVARSGWLGYKGATEKTIASLERRLGVRLPESYRQFLAASNGWRVTGAFINEVWPASRSFGFGPGIRTGSTPGWSE